MRTCGAVALLAGSVMGCSGSGGGNPPGADTNGSSSGSSSSSGSGGASSGATSGSSGGGPGASSGGSGSSGGAASSSGGSGGSSSGSAASSGAGSGSSGGSGTPDGGPVWTPPSSSPAHFHWQLSTNFASTDILSGQQGLVVYDIDGENSTAADVTAIHNAGAKAVCYVDVGSLETGRSDYSQFPSSVVGPGVQGWAGENWLMVTAANQSVILPLMKARLMSWCQAKGFDAVEPDNLDAFANGVNVTEADNVSYDLAIAALAHGMSMSIGVKNLLPAVTMSSESSAIQSTFDWVLAEQCYQYSECSSYTAFALAGKAVFDVEYGRSPDCASAAQSHINAQERDLNLAGPHASGYTYTPCIPDSQTTW
ncbi:MAG: endo alpha-1,4 polygalactosaminidase [Polyangiaceae bacterium]